MPRRKIPSARRLEIAMRAGFLCEYCHTPEDFTTDTFNIEHILPILHGGSEAEGNLAYSCGGCNGNKHFHISWNDPDSGQSSPLFHPRKDKWEEHFSWSEELILLVGQTRKGRATIDLLKMNRPGLVNLRKALLAYGAHPGASFTPPPPPSPQTGNRDP